MWTTLKNYRQLNASNGNQLYGGKSTLSMHHTLNAPKKQLMKTLESQ